MIFLKKLGFTPCKSEQPLPRHGVTIKRNAKKKKKKKRIQEICSERTYSSKVSVNSKLRAT